MRKLLLILNAILKTLTPWSERVSLQNGKVSALLDFKDSRSLIHKRTLSQLF